MNRLKTNKFNKKLKSLCKIFKKIMKIWRQNLIIIKIKKKMNLII